MAHSDYFQTGVFMTLTTFGVRTLALAAALCFSSGAALAATPYSAFGASALSGGGASSAFIPSTGSMATIGLDVSGIESFNLFSFGAPTDNFVTFLQLAPFAQVLGTAYDVTLNAFTPSWLSEMQIYFTDSEVTVGVVTRPGVGLDNAGIESFTAAGALPADLVFNVGADGILRIEFAEGFDDASVSPDGIWESGTFTFEVSAIPEPSTYGLMALGLLGVAAAARRRKA
jgi:hypothetical protein